MPAPIAPKAKPTIRAEIRDDVRQWLRGLGFVHADEIEEASGTSPRSRQRWALRPVYFGNEPYYRLRDVKAHLDSRADAAMDSGHEPPSAAAFL